MPHSNGIDNHNFRFGRISRKLDLRTPLFYKNLLPSAYRLFVYVYTVSPGLIVMMAMV